MHGSKPPQDQATRLAIGDLAPAGVDIITDGEIRRESYANRFATALTRVDLDNSATVMGAPAALSWCRASPARSAGCPSK